jgi:hypothetical protein
VRWERLFGDLEAELDAAEAAELESDIAERTRSERARLRLVDRLLGSVGRQVSVRMHGAGQRTGEIRAVGVDWLLVRTADGADHLIRTAALLELAGLSALSATEGPEGQRAARLSLPALLRRLARDRTIVTITLIDGSSRTGTIELAGADVVEFSDRRHDEPGFAGPSQTFERRSVPLRAVAVIREH